MAKLRCVDKAVQTAVAVGGQQLVAHLAPYQQRERTPTLQSGSFK